MQMYLTLPLPVEKTRTAEVNIVHVDGFKAPALHAVDVPKSGTIGDLYAALAQVRHILNTLAAWFDLPQVRCMQFITVSHTVHSCDRMQQLGRALHDLHDS